MHRPIIHVVFAVLALQFGASAPAAELLVSAAASLTNAFTHIGQEFEQRHPATKVLFNFGGSGQLLQQIAKGAPVDIFASADQETMNRASKESLVEDNTRFDFARNALVVVVPSDSVLRFDSLRQLTGRDVRHIAVGNPDSVPVGRYSKAALLAAGVWDALRGRIVNTQNVRQSLDYVARGEVDAAFVYRTDAAILPDKVRIMMDVPTNEPILYPIAVVKSSNNKSAAREFVVYLRSGAARKILVKYGFGGP
ncbi:MAG TPA: molybdate ABC transporter substrate-binding protein [Burkholderiales bacterium]|jgi:molybdate transport system substrate-binding protein|nr:molybdate ABC transporter substrate-binding protein [Burkholderiales bacterium]